MIKFALRSAIVVLALPLVAGCALMEGMTKHGEAYKSALAAEKSGDYASAVARTVQAIELEPGYANAISLFKSLYPKAVSHYDTAYKAAQGAKDLPELRGRYAIAKSMQKVQDEAKKLKYPLTHPKEGWTFSAELKDRQGEVDASATALREALYLAGVATLKADDWEERKKGFVLFREIQDLGDKSYKNMAALASEAYYKRGAELDARGDRPGAAEAVKMFEAAESWTSKYKDALKRADAAKARTALLAAFEDKTESLDHDGLTMLRVQTMKALGKSVREASTPQEIERAELIIAVDKVDFEQGEEGPTTESKTLSEERWLKADGSPGAVAKPEDLKLHAAYLRQKAQEEKDTPGKKSSVLIGMENGLKEKGMLSKATFSTSYDEVASRRFVKLILAISARNAKSGETAGSQSLEYVAESKRVSIENLRGDTTVVAPKGGGSSSLKSFDALKSAALGKVGEDDEQYQAWVKGIAKKFI